MEMERYMKIMLKLSKDYGLREITLIKIGKIDKKLYIRFLNKNEFQYPNI